MTGAKTRGYKFLGTRARAGLFSSGTPPSGGVKGEHKSENPKHESQSLNQCTYPGSRFLSGCLVDSRPGFRLSQMSFRGAVPVCQSRQGPCGNIDPNTPLYFILTLEVAAFP